MPAMTMIQALRSAMDVMLERDPNVVVFGEDVGYFGGVFRCTEGLQAKYGKSRVFDTPISEGGIVGAAVGMGAYGLRPVAEIQFADYFYPASDQIVSEAARLRYRSAGEFSAPITLRMPCGGGIYGGQTHSQSPEALFTHVCGVRTVMPSNPYDAKGLLIASIENDDPVIFLEPKRLYNGPFDGHHDRPVVPWSKHPLGEVPEGYYTVPLESARLFRPGNDLTVLTYGTMLFVSEAAALEAGLDAEIIDLRSIWPLDLDALVTSVKKTGRCVVVHEATRTSGFGAELASLVQEHCFYHLEAPIERVTGWDTPYPHAQEWAYFPDPKRIGEAFRRVMER
ncbi:MAG TPA: alpha-ketoacid dehydrogenase subunit beta [Casimicrobiaceae bacterium]